MSKYPKRQICNPSVEFENFEGCLILKNTKTKDIYRLVVYNNFLGIIGKNLEVIVDLEKPEDKQAPD